MAHGCEPNVVKAIMEQLRPHVHGMNTVSQTYLLISWRTI